MKFCSACGHEVVFRIPDGDTRPRFLCDGCETIHYQNPRIVTGCLVSWEDRVLLCKRDIEPRRGYWTLPAGYLENGETTEAGAIRETWEEARATVHVEDLYTLFSLPHISQVYMFYRGRLLEPAFEAGDETAAVGLFLEEEIPWSELAFPVVGQTLKHFFEDRRRATFQFRATNLIVEPRRGSR